MTDLLIFLDIDGVLNSENTNYVPDEAPLDPVNIDPFNRLVAATEARIVISSTWRFFTDIHGLREYFHEAGIGGELIDVTPDLKGYDPPTQIEITRGEEINSWLRQREQDGNPVPEHSFVILDDCNDMEPYLERLVQTDFATGLTDEDVDRAIELLKK